MQVDYRYLVPHSQRGVLSENPWIKLRNFILGFWSVHKLEAECTIHSMVMLSALNIHGTVEREVKGEWSRGPPRDI